MKSLRLLLSFVAVGAGAVALAQSLRAPAPSLHPSSPAASAPATPSTPGLGQPPVNQGAPASGLAREPAHLQPAALSGQGLKGFADLHTHPLANLAWGRKLIHGGPDVGALLPADAKCQHDVRATSIDQALGDDNPTHGGWGTDNPCGDDFRKTVVHTLQSANKAFVTPDHSFGAPTFNVWPRWNDITHQKMWVDWIRRAHDAGLRVMVALAVNNKTLADGVAGTGDAPTDDKASADLQIAETKAFVGRHHDFMELAFTPQDLERIVRAGKLAVVLGVEIDDIGNFNKVPKLDDRMIADELGRLFHEGVRYVFPIHVLDNPFGGTAVYEDWFNESNYREAGHFWDLGCSQPSERIAYRYKAGFDFLTATGMTVKLGMDGFRQPPPPPTCSGNAGHVNKQGLTRQGEFALREMMRLGMIIDTDHMSQRSFEGAIVVARKAAPGGYPLNSGHNCMRNTCGASENQRTAEQLKQLAALGGMAGVGTAGIDAKMWLRDYAAVVQALGSGGGAGFGTDTDGLVMSPRPRQGSNVVYDAKFPASRSGSREWNYNKEGVAHYGMFADFIQDVRSLPGGAKFVDEHLMSSADAFWRMWQKCEAQKSKVVPGA